MFEGHDLLLNERVAIKIISYTQYYKGSNFEHSAKDILPIENFPFTSMNAQTPSKIPHNNDFHLKAIFHETKLISYLRFSKYVVKIRDVIVESEESLSTANILAIDKHIEKESVRIIIYTVMNICIDCIENIFSKFALLSNNEIVHLIFIFIFSLTRTILLVG